MTSAKTLHKQGIFLLVLTTILWGTSFPLLKDALDVFSPPVLVAVRFTFAAIVLIPWLRGMNFRLLRDGALLGILYFAETSSALLGLESISANRSAFLIGLNVIFVPLLSTILGQRLSGRVLFAAGLALLGIGIMSWEGGGLGRGDFLTLGAAIGIAAYILVMAAVTPHHPTLPLTTVQLMVMSLLGMIWATPELIAHTDEIASHFGVLLYLGLGVTATPIWTQTMAQRWIPAHEAALLYTLEPVFAVVFSFFLLGEQLSIRGFMGAGLILGATIFSQTQPFRKSIAIDRSVPNE